MKTCIICKQAIKQLPQENLDSAGFVTFDFHFGSKNDLEVWQGYIHDECAEEFKKHMHTKEINFS